MNALIQLSDNTPSLPVNYVGFIPSLVCLTLFIIFLQALPTIAAGETLRFVYPWVPSVGFNMSMMIDGLSLTFALLISGIGALVMLYSSRYLQGDQHFARFHLYLILFMLSMLGLVLSDNLMTMFVFWELTTLTSYLLIGYKHSYQQSRRSALQALLVTGCGGLALLAGILMIQMVTGTFELSEIRGQGDIIKNSELYLPILILVLFGAFTKSGQFPFHFWLPNAMAAPTPVSAYLHSATMVKAGIYLLARLHPSLSGTDAWFWSLTLTGAVTAVFASVLALQQMDFKQSLAYTTLMALGTLTLLLGSDTGYAITAAMTFLIVHSLYKAALFLIVGIVDHATGVRDLKVLGGLRTLMPFTAGAAAIAALSMAGFPPFLGFIGKELKYAGALAIEDQRLLVVGAILLANALMFAVACILAFKPFWSQKAPSLPESYQEPWQMLLGPIVLALLGVVFGVFPHLISVSLVHPAVAAIIGQDQAKKLVLWAGINMPLILSVATFILGFLIYKVHVPLRDGLIGLATKLPNFDRGWDKLLAGFSRCCTALTQTIQNGRLQHYVFVTLLTLTTALLSTFMVFEAWTFNFSLEGMQIKHWVVVSIIVAGCFLTLVTASRVAAIAGLGSVGIGVALIFISYGAPDVAITQLLVETLVVVLFGAAALKLPHLNAVKAPVFRPFDALLSISVGLCFTVLLLLVTGEPLDRRITEFFEATSWTEAYGRNIVNVILVDFRAIDTFGEIAVVFAAALGAMAALKMGMPEKEGRPEKQRSEP